MGRAMTEKEPAPSSDEAVACRLLGDWLAGQGISDFRCEIAAKDPPDLILSFDDGERWGIEVTRTYQQVRRPGADVAESWRSIGEDLWKLGENIGKATKGMRRHSYTLHLQAPGLGSTWGRSQPRRLRRSIHEIADLVLRLLARQAPKQEQTKAWNAWKRDIKAEVTAHVASGADGRLNFPGGNLQSGGPGDSWRVSVAAPAVELSSALRATLRRAVVDKAADLHEWKKQFTQRWLLLLNCYPLADRRVEMEEAVRRIAREDANVARFDGILWSGADDRRLVRMSLR